jgi:hypothetical protein
MREQIVNVPKAFLVWTQMPREARRQSIQRAADVDVIAARKLERAQFANADCLCTRKQKNERVRAAGFAIVKWLASLF